MDPIQPNQVNNTPPIVTPEVSSPSQNNLDPKSSSKSRSVVLILVLLIFGLLSLLFYLYHQNTQLKQQVELIELDNPTAVTCDYNGQTYEVGEGFTATDGCNSCSCSETGQVACTLMACEPTTENSDQSDITKDWKTYQGDGYLFKFPSGWKLQKFDEYREYLGNRLVQLNLTSPDENLLLIIGLKKPSDNFAIFGRTGVGSGEFTTGESVNIGGQQILSSQLVWENKVKEIYYSNTLGPDTIELSGNQMVVELISNKQNEYETFDLRNTPELEVVKQILSTFEFTD